MTTSRASLHSDPFQRFSSVNLFKRTSIRAPDSRQQEAPPTMPMPPLPSVPSSRPSPTDPLYSSSTLTPSSATPPPSYRSTRPASSEPATYGSLADLTKNKPARQTQTQAFSYTPQPERQGYRSAYDEVPTGTGAGRKMPPPPGNYGVDANPAPPRRNAPTPGMPHRNCGLE